MPDRAARSGNPPSAATFNPAEVPDSVVRDETTSSSPVQPRTTDLGGGGVDDRLRRLCEAIRTSGKRISAVPPAEAWARHVEDARRGLPLVDAEAPGSIVDVGSGNGVPGLVLAIERPTRQVFLVEANGRKAQAIDGMISDLSVGNATVVPERAETAALEAHRDRHTIAVCRALAPVAVSLEYCLPLIAVGGCLIAWLGEVDRGLASAVASQLGGELERIVHVVGSERRNLVVVRKVEPTGGRFPRRPGMATKRPLPMR